LVETSEIFDPAQGFQVQEEYQGTELGIDVLSNAVLLAGGRTTRTRKGGAHVLQVRWASLDQKNGGPETANDNYSIECEEVQPSIWEHPTVTFAADLSGDPYLWRKAVENFLKNPTPAAFGNLSPEGQQVAQYLLRGGSVFASHIPVLSRQRTFSLQYTTKLKVEAVPAVYTTSAMVSSFGIPSAVAAQLPDNPTIADGVTPSGTVWAWKIRRQNTRYVPALNKVEETIDWIFSAWATWVYPLIG
jgi:hypothetical protein